MVIPATRMFALAMAAASFAMAGCGGPYTYWQEGVSHPTGHAPHSIASRGTSLTVVRENPFADDRESAGIFAAIQSSFQGHSYKFTRGDPPPDWNGYTLVLTFADGVIGNGDACRNATPPLLRSPAGRTAIIADYCFGPIVVAEVKGWIDDVTGPQDPRLTALVHGILSEMFLQRPPFTRDADDT